jgi:hypothetical protein
VSFISTLKPEELSMLRKIVRKVHFAYVVEKMGDSFIDDYKCDQLIDSIAPEAVQNMIKFGIDKGLR